ncbi:unnamed protein product [Alternaria alternata]
MGLTGAGKSTTDVTFRTLQRKNGQEIYLIDTPGFDDTKLEYAAVFRKIASWICTYCDGNRRGLRVGGMIYVQRITDMRMSGSSLKSLRIFEKICGERNFRDVVVVTTMWGSLKTNEARDAAVMRMKMMEERPEFFGNLIRGGARMEKSQGDGQSGVRIVELLADRRKTVVLQLQHEMRGGMKLEGTTAGRYLEGELVHTRERYEAQKRELEECAEEVHDDDDLRSEFLEQIEDCTRLVNNIVDDQGSLSVTLEDMWNEQAVSCGAGRDDQAEDTTQENTSAHIVKLEHKIQGLERKIEAQRDDLDAQREEIERIEAASKEIAEAKERDQVARTKVKERRAPHNEAILWMQNFFAGRRPENFVQPPRRADSMPLETKASRKSSITSWQKRSRSKSRQSRKPDNMRTYSEEQTKQSYIASHYHQGTVSVQVVPCTFEGGAKIYLVDTPGFDDTYRTDSEILREVALWLNKAHSEKLRLAGIIFLQRISDVRVGGSGIKNIRMFQKLCGDGPLASVVLATTMWDMATKDAAIQREKELKEQPQLWKKMIDHGSVVFRHDKKEASALKIIKYLMKKKRPVTLDIQREMVDEKRELIDTGAGEALASNMEALIKLYEGKLRNLEQEFREARKEDREMLEEQKREHEESLAKQRREMEKLHVNRLQLIEEEKKRFEESQREAKEEMQRAKENFAAELGKQKKHIREQYIREMQRCNVM